MAIQEICAVRANEYLGSGLYRMVIETEKIAASAACGQFVHLTCGEGNLLRRPISICDADSETGTLTMLYEVKGDGTAWLAARRAGDKIDVLGPLGHGFDAAKLGARPVLLGGGIGVPPMLLTAKTCAKNGAAVTMIAGARTRDLVVLEPEFSDFDYTVCTDDGSYGVHGFVTDVLREKITGATGVAACGPKPMLKAIAAIAKQAGVPCQVSMEERMGCGIGACLVCACALSAKNGETRYGHVCKDGPVFDAEEVQW